MFSSCRSSQTHTTTSEPVQLQRNNQVPSLQHANRNLAYGRGLNQSENSQQGRGRIPVLPVVNSNGDHVVQHINGRRPIKREENRNEDEYDYIHFYY